MSDSALECRGLVKRYGDVTAVDGLDLAVRRGECFGLLGPNGAGKTTTVEIFEGLLQPTGGEVRVLGLTWNGDADGLRQRLGIQLQETQFSDKLTVGESVRMFRSFYHEGLDPDDAIAQVSLQEKARARFSTLSGGQKQRMSLACALVCDPEVLFLDEPTTGLDPASRRQIWDIVARFRERGRTVMMTTHYMEEAEKLCDRVAIVDHGKVIAQGTPRELIATLGAEHVVSFHTAGEIPLEELRSLDGVTDVLERDGGVCLEVSHVHRALPALLADVARRGIELTDLSTHHATLDDVFLHHTGRQLRDD